MSRPIEPRANGVFLSPADKIHFQRIWEESGIQAEAKAKARLEERLSKGGDWREMVAQRKAEKQAAEALGLTLPYCRPKKEDA